MPELSFDKAQIRADGEAADSAGHCLPIHFAVIRKWLDYEDALEAERDQLRAELEQARQQLIEQRAEAWRLRRAWENLDKVQPVDAWGRVMVSLEYIGRVLNGEEPC